MPGKKARVRQPRRQIKRMRPGVRIKDPIPVAPLRDRFVMGLERGDYTIGDVVQWIGRPRSETSWLQRRLGLKPEGPAVRRGVRYEPPAEHHGLINRELAYRIAEGIGFDPVDLDSWVEEYGFDLAGEDAA